MADPGVPQTEDTPKTPPPERPVPGQFDVYLAGALALLGAFAVAALPDGSALRIALVLPVLFFAPGYLLLQALPIPRVRRWSHGVHALLAIGVSPAIVGLLALSTALIPGGFRPAPIVTVVTVASLALAAVALYRRHNLQTTRHGGRSPA